MKKISTRPSKLSGLSLLLVTLATSVIGCANKPMMVEGVWFETVDVSGVAHIGGVQAPIKSTYKNVYLIHEDTLAEMLKQ